VDYLFDLDDVETAEINVFAKKVAEAIRKAVPCIRIGSAVIGLEVPHAHIHLIPIRQEKDMLFSNPKLKLSPEEMAQIASDIRAQL
jgi:histidine triad (HIT) family protein